MRRLQNLTGRFQTPRRGFTLIEMLAVVTLIGLLITILIPAVSRVRTMAKVTGTKAAIASLETGLQTLKVDTRFGGSFVPSSPDGDGKNGLAVGKVANPYSNIGIQGNDFEITGTGLLVWALAGADLLGPPGFRVFDTKNSTTWAEDTHDKKGGAYQLDNTTAQPLKPRSSPYVDLDKVAISKYNAGEESFEIPAELKARASLGLSLVTRKYPMFLDTFGQPILYWKADSAGVLKCDRTIGGNKSGKKVALKDRGVYHHGDNKALVFTVSKDVLILTSAWSDSRGAAKTVHRLNFGPTNVGYGGNGAVKGPASGFFPHYIWNQNIAARLEPHKKNSFMLISAGPDGLYGTADDIANFEHNGQ